MGRGIRRVGRIAALLLPFALAACQSLFRPAVPSGEAVAVGPDGPFIAPTVGGDPTIKALACDLDHLEKHIEWYGSVTAKVPDVWGQARLTQYRDEFEKAMSAEITNFGFSLNGSESRSDQSYFASATALSFAAQPKPPLIGSVRSDKSAAPNLIPTAQTVQQQVTNPTAGTTTTTNTTYGLQPPPPAAPAPPAPIKPIDLGDPGTLVSATDTVIKRTDPKLFQPGFGSGVVALEPTELLAQKQRYLNFLNQIRRENEGDDTADSPGYSLNLMRIPVSLLPGKKTEIGYGAEITMSLNPILGADLLPMTFRNLLVNDIENQLGFPMTQILNVEKGLQQYLSPDYERFIHILTRFNDYESTADDWGGMRKAALLEYLRLPENSPDPRWRESQLDRAALARHATNEMKDFFVANGVNLESPHAPATPASRSPNKREAPELFNVTRTVLLAKVADQFKTPALSFANGLDNRTAFPTSQILDIYGPEAVFDILYAAQKALNDGFRKQGYAHLPDVQAYLREETRAAYEFLKKNPHLWAVCDEQLAEAIRSQRWGDVYAIRRVFRTNVALLTKSEPSVNDKGVDYYEPSTDALHLSRITGLAWCLIVDAALLNDRLIRDMKETATSKGRPLAGCDHWCQYFLPDPAPECRQAFNDYVKLRWPIHVFALDPYNQEQNIADSLSTRRETQLALSIAFTNGMISARNLTKYTRRLEAEYETIALNRTHIGFSHGENTFGWRFYPRYQTPDTPSNAEDLFRNQFIGGPNRNQLLRERRLEPGIRECVAIVIMPSFVPYVEVDTISNWFPITNPKHKCLDTAHAMKLSRTVQTIKVGGCGVKDACDYRDGEYQRLLRRADQLEARLPTQTLTSPVPILNTYGGFEMFSNGTTDLAPELFGWYGAPGIDPDADTTTLFLVGDHFSPLRTKVIVGNQAIVATSQTMLSRQVIQVTFPKGAYTLPTAEGGEVRIHLATPYGVTRELAVPVSVRKPTPRPGISVAAAPLTIQYATKQAAPAPAPAAGQPAPATDPTAASKSGFVATAVIPETFKLKWVGLDPTAATVTDLRVKFVFTIAGTSGQPASIIAVPCGDGAKAQLTVTPATDPTAAANSGDLTIDAEDLKHMAADLFLQKAVQDLAASGQLASGLTTTQILVTAINPTPPTDPTKPAPANATKPATTPPKAVNRSILTNDQLTITFKVGTYSKDSELSPTPSTKPTDVTYTLSSGAAVSITYTVDAGKVAKLTSTASATIQGPATGAPATATVSIKDGSTTAPISVTPDPKGAYQLLPADFQKAVDAWLKQFVKVDEPFTSDAALKAKIPAKLTLQITPAGATSATVVGDVTVTVVPAMK